jgi:uncharacterized membrane protein YfcA
MDLALTALVVLAGFSVSIISASVGGTALIMVPLLVAIGVEPKVAIATNKFAIMFLSLAAVLRFRKSVSLPPGRVVSLLVLPVVLGSVAGAALVVRAPASVTRLIIGTAAIVVALFLFARRDAGLNERTHAIEGRETIWTLLVLLPLSVYGGFFSGGYATLLTYTLVMMLGLSFLQGAAATRLLSIFSTGAASIIFAREGVIDYTLGVFLCAAYFAGATLGAHVAMRKGNRWLKTLFLIAVIVLALRILIMEIVGRFAG